MKRKTSTAPTRIYTYGCRLPTKGADLVESQLKLARVYYNKLLEIEIAQRKAIQDAMAAVADVDAALVVVSELKAQVEAEQTIIKAAKAAARSGAVDVHAQRARIRELMPQLRAAREVLKAAKDASKTPEMLARFAAIREEANAAVRAARASCGVYWGTYLLVEQAIEAARKSKTDLKFRRWDGCGRVGVELMKGLPVPAVFGQDTRLQIDPLPTTGSKRGQTMTRVRIRVGSDEKKEPVWAEFPFRMHRPLPADGVIKWAWIHRTFKGRWVNWDLQIVVEAPSFARSARPASDGGVVALDIGWRKRAGAKADAADLRVGYWYDDQGNHDEIRLDADIRRRLDFANKLRATQDSNFNEAKTALLAWLDESPRELPEQLAAALAYIVKWKSAKRLGATVKVWRENRIAGDEAIFERLDTWWKQHRHLYDWESSQRDRTLGCRKDFYRNIAARMTRRYAVIVIEDLDLRELIKKAAPESEKENAPTPVQHNRVIAAPSKLREAIKSAAPGNGCRVVELDPAYTTIQCNRCGRREKWDAAANLSHTCECGHTWDQDYNAAVNLLAMYASGDVVLTPPPSTSGAAMGEKVKVLENAGASSDPST